MNMNKKIVYLIILILSMFIFRTNTYAISSKTTWNSNTEELEYKYKAGVVGIRRVWLECTGAKETTITLYNSGFTKEEITGSVSTDSLINGSYNCKAHVETGGDNDDREMSGDVSFVKKNFTGTTNNTSDTSNNGVGWQKVDCDSVDKKENCNSGDGCIWDKAKNKCEFGFVAENPCSQDEILHVLHFLGYLLFIAKFMVPLLIIGFGTFDLFKAVIDKDEKSFTKQLRIVGVRVIIGLIVFFLPTIVSAVLSLSSTTSTYQERDYQMCADCLLKPTSGNCNYN